MYIPTPSTFSTPTHSLIKLNCFVEEHVCLTRLNIFPRNFGDDGIRNLIPRSATVSAVGYIMTTKCISTMFDDTLKAIREFFFWRMIPKHIIVMLFWFATVCDRWWWPCSPKGRCSRVVGRELTQIQDLWKANWLDTLLHPFAEWIEVSPLNVTTKDRRHSGKEQTLLGNSTFDFDIIVLFESQQYINTFTTFVPTNLPLPATQQQQWRPPKRQMMPAAGPRRQRLECRCSNPGVDQSWVDWRISFYISLVCSFEASFVFDSRLHWRRRLRQKFLQPLANMYQLLNL